MTSIAMVKRAGQHMADAVAAGDWSRADRELQYFAGAWQRARVRGAASQELATFTDSLRVTVMDDHDVAQEVGPEQFGWMLAGVCAFLSQSTTPTELSGTDVRSRILEALAVDDESYPTAELAARVGRSVGAVARELPKLRDAGYATQRAAGRQTLNSITDEGRALSARLAAERLCREEEASREWPTTLDRVNEPDLVPINARDLVQHVRPNDVAALKRAAR